MTAQDSHTAILRQRAEYEYEFYKQHGRPPRPFHMKCLRCEQAWEQDATLVDADHSARYHAGYHGGYREEHAEIVVTDATGRELFRHHAIHTEGKKESGCPACGAHSYGNGVSCPECGHIPEVHRMYPEDPEEPLVPDGGTETEHEFKTGTSDIVCTECCTCPRLLSLKKNSGTVVGCDCDDVKHSMDSVPYELGIHDLPDSWVVIEERTEDGDWEQIGSVELDYGPIDARGVCDESVMAEWNHIRYHGNGDRVRVSRRLVPETLNDLFRVRLDEKREQTLGNHNREEFGWTEQERWEFQKPSPGGGSR